MAQRYVAGKGLRELAARLSRFLSSAVLAAAALGLSGCASTYFRDAGVPPPPRNLTLSTLPHKDIWTGIVFNGAKIGFSHLRVENLPAESLHRLESEAVMRFRLLGFEKYVRMQAEDIVRDDLSLQRFQYRYHIDGSEIELQGEVRDGKLVYMLSRGGSPSRREEILSGPVYPASAITLMPVLAGLAPGRAREFTVFSGELQKLAEAAQRVDGYEQSALFPGKAFKVTTELAGLKTTSWIDAEARPVLELGLNGVMISALEPEATAKGYLAAAALNKDEVFVEWSRVPVDRPITDARATRRLRLEFSGAARAFPANERQQCVRAGANFVCDIDVARRPLAIAVDTRMAELPTTTVQSSYPSIRRLAAQLVHDRPSSGDKIAALLDWLEQNIRKEPADVFSALDVLEQKRAECQGHAYLYAALARAAGIATRVVNGLVYSPEYQGFLYHTWAESLVDGRWHAVDPTFAQPEADATHIALVYGETLGDLVPLVDWVGRLRATLLEQ